MDRADRRPPDGFVVGIHEVNGVARPAIAAAVPSRLTIPLPLPRRATFRTSVALADPPAGTTAAPVHLRVGVSDHRIYEGVADLLLVPGKREWVDLHADLSAYAGWKVSLFYRPDRIVWRVVLAADATGNGPSTVLWGVPEIVADTESAREYSVRRQQLR